MQYYQKQLALGSEAAVSLVSHANERTISHWYQEIWADVFQFERRFSRFLPASELSAFNRRAGLKHAISPELRAILVAAKELSLKTKGLYNPFILPALQAAGYKHSFVKGYEQDAVDDHSNRTVVQIEALEIGDDWARIPHVTALDLGGCGKGYLADQLADMTQDWDIEGYWFSLGGDIVAGGVNDAGERWHIDIQSAQGSGTTDIGTLRLPADGRRYAVATSGTTTRRGTHDKKDWHHIIDPRTLKPADTDVILATVGHESALYADVLASCAVIVGSDRATAFLRRHGVDNAVIQYETQKKHAERHYGDGVLIGKGVANT